MCETHSFSWAIVAFFTAFVPASLFVGGWIVRSLAPGIPEEGDFPTRFLAGFFAVNTVLCLLALFSPFPIVASAIGIFASTAALEFAWKRKRTDITAFDPASGDSPKNHLAGLICVVLALVGSTIWSRDSLTCEVPSGDVTIFKPFGDSFCHAYFLSRVAAPGIPRDCAWESGRPLGPYHFGSYTVPAVLTKISNTSPYQAFNGLQVPLGLLLVGLAAFVLVKNWWGPWPGVMASAVIFLPDAAWLGMQNYWFSFHWLLQIGPGLSYGIALAAYSWMLMFRGCQTGDKKLLLSSFLGLALCVLYKYHIFVANALLLWGFPAFFMASWSWKKRLGWLGFALTTFLLAVSCSNHFLAGRAPPLWLDGSAVKTSMTWFASMIEVERLRSFFSRFTSDSSMPRDLLWGSLLLLNCVFGLLTVAWIALSVLLGKRAGRIELAFPFLVVANYLVMTLGFPKNTGVGEVDELIHRPFVWAYFVVAAWVGGAAYFYCFENRPPQKRGVSAALCGAFFIFLSAPLFSHRLIHQGTAQEWTAKYCRIPVPTGLVDCCRFVREHSRAEDIIQDSKFDPHLVAMGLAGLRSYVSGIDFSKCPPGVPERVAEITLWLTMQSEDEIRRFATQNKIRWLILHPGDAKAWPRALLNRPDFESGGYRVYCF